MSPRVTEVWIRGLRPLADVSLRLDGLTVLIGDNGAGKSSLIEGLELIRKLAEPNFFGFVADAHGGLNAVLTAGVSELERWLKDYRGLGELRADGELGTVIADEVPDAEGARAG